nr:BppU family phage baseplate upper protein [Limosilactobacillus mucosae]
MAVNEYVELDILKPGTTLVNLTNNFQGRVGDSRAFCKLWIKANGLPYDLTKDNRSVGFAGKDPVGDSYRAVGWADTDQAGDNAQAGRVTYYFPAGMFKYEGDWDTDSTYFYVQDSKGTVSTVNVWLHVLPNLVEMGVNATPYMSDMDKAVAEVQNKANEVKSQLSNILNGSAFTGLTSQLKAMQDTINGYSTLINSKQVPTTDQMQAYVQGLLTAQTASTDLNLLTSPGQTYYVASTTVSNNPDGKTGFLSVKGNASNLCQVFVDNEANEFIRSRMSGTWTAWRRTTAWNYQNMAWD